MARMKKGVWMHGFTRFQGPQAIRDWVSSCADAGFDLIIPCVKNPDGLLDYQSRVGTIRPQYRYWDPLEVAATEARRRKISLHAWFCNAKESDASALMAKNPGFAALDASGKRVRGGNHYFVCMARPQVRSYQAALMKEVADRYDVDGVHFDYIRVGDGCCYCAFCRKALKKLEGLEPREVRSWGRVPDRFYRWRCDNITKLVRDVSARARRRGKEVSAAVFAGVPDNVMFQGQDFAAWSRAGLLDYVFPMNYWNSPWLMEKYLLNHLAQNKGGKAEMWQGLGRYCMETPARFKEQLSILKEHKVPGVVIFEHRHLKAKDYSILSRF